MPTGAPIETAASVLCEVGGLPASADPPEVPLVGVVLDAIERFAAVPFEVPDSPEADGFLFQYGVFSTIADGAFLVSVLRQFDVVDDDGDHECYVQVECEFRFPPDEELTAARGESWWFADGPEPFADWFARVRADPVWASLDGRTPMVFAITQNAV